MLGSLILAGVGALCMSNPRRRRKARRAKSRRKNPGLKWIRVGSRARADGYKADHGGVKYYVARSRKGSWYASAQSGSSIPLSQFYGSVTQAKAACENYASTASNPRRGRKTCRNPKPRDLTEHEFTRGAAHVTVATWRNANATAFVAVTARGPGGVKTWEAKSQGPSSGGFSKPQQALERVYNKMTGKWPVSQGDALIKVIAALAGEYVGAATNPRRRRKSRRK